MKAPTSATEAVTQFHKFVVKEALQFTETPGISKDDLIQEGLIAVAQAFSSWRPDGGANFLTWIRRPVRFAMRAWVLKQKKAGGSLRGGTRSRKGEGAVLFSMDAPCGNERLKDPFNDFQEYQPTMHSILGSEDDMFDFLARKRLPELLSRLDRRERRALRLRFVDGLTHAQVGAKMKISRSLVSQIEKTALAKLKALMTASSEVEA